MENHYGPCPKKGMDLESLITHVVPLSRPIGHGNVDEAGRIACRWYLSLVGQGILQEGDLPGEIYVERGMTMSDLIYLYTRETIAEQSFGQQAILEACETGILKNVSRCRRRPIEEAAQIFAGRKEYCFGLMPP